MGTLLGASFHEQNHGSVVVPLASGVSRLRIPTVRLLFVWGLVVKHSQGHTL